MAAQGQKTDSQLLSSDGLIYLRLVRISELSNSIYDFVSTEWQRNAINYYYAIQNFAVLLRPHMTDDDDKAIKRLQAEFEDIYFQFRKPAVQKAIRLGQQAYINLTIELANSILDLLVRRLAENGMYMEGIAAGQWADEDEDEPAASYLIRDEDDPAIQERKHVLEGLREQLKKIEQSEDLGDDNDNEN